MRLGQWVLLGAGVVIVGCATGAAATNVRAPLAARLTPGAATGAMVPLRADPAARVILSNAAGLPPASFLPSQAARGREVYAESCGSCHELSQHVGQAFVESWNDRRVYDFYTLVRATMPLDNPGGLKEQQYVDVVAYLMDANHQAASSPDSLRPDTAAMRTHKIAVRFP